MKKTWMTSLCHVCMGGSEVGIDAKHLSKVWHISFEDAKQTMNATTQHGTHLPNPAMNQNYTTNDRMLQYFFMDNFFATRKGGTSSRGNTCCQLLITDKGFIYIVPMKRNLKSSWQLNNLPRMLVLWMRLYLIWQKSKCPKKFDNFEI